MQKTIMIIIIILEESMWLTTLYNDFDGLVRFIQFADAIFGPVQSCSFS